MARILLATPEGQQVVELRDHNSLGRHPNNSIQLLDKIVSKEHCILEQRDGGFVLRDLGSLNGTYVNGERVNGERPLRHGDEIALGSTRARLDDNPMVTGQIAQSQASPAGPASPSLRTPGGPGTARAPVMSSPGLPLASAAAPSTASPPVPSFQRAAGFTPVAA